MTRSMTITVNSERVSPARSIAAAARFAPLLILTGRALDDLAAELGSDEAAYRHLLCVSTNVNRPIGCNFPTPDGSRTVFLAPRHWTQERLRGWVGAHHEAIEAMFGAVVPLAVEDL